MSAAAPGATFRFPVRVYYEDTDAAGVVYYANYLKFFKAGISLRMTYASQDQGEVRKVVIVPKDCGL